MFRDGGAEAIARERGLDLEEAKHQWGSDGESLGPNYTRASLRGVHCRRGESYSHIASCSAWSRANAALPGFMSGSVSLSQ